MRAVALLVALVFTLTGCTIGAPSEPTLGADGKPLPRLYPIKERDVGKIQLRMLDSVNALRGATGAIVIRFVPGRFRVPSYPW